MAPTNSVSQSPRHVFLILRHNVAVRAYKLKSLSFAFKRETANARQSKKVNIGGKEQLNYRLFKTLLYNPKLRLKKENLKRTNTRKYCQEISTLPFAVDREREA